MSIIRDKVNYADGNIELEFATIPSRLKVGDLAEVRNAVSQEIEFDTKDPEEITEEIGELGAATFDPEGITGASEVNLSYDSNEL